MATIKKEHLFTVLEKSAVNQKPAAYPTPAELKVLASKLELPLAAGNNNNRFGFTLNAHDPVAAGKAFLAVPLNKYVTVKDWGKPPYYYSFSQWFFDGAWIDNVPGKVTITFNRNFVIQNGIIFLRVGGSQPLTGSGTGYTIKSGNTIRLIHSAHDNSAGFDTGFVSQVIPISIKTPDDMLRKSLSPIEITSNMGSWKFFDAHYDPRIVI